MKEKFKPLWMGVASLVSAMSSAKRLQVGAVIVKDNRIISIGYNGMPSGWDNECEYETEEGLRTRPEVLHAESNAIAKVARSSDSSEGASLFCTHTPCIECAKLIYQSGITEVYIGQDYDARKGCGEDFLRSAGIKIEKIG